ncbi:hypothetical protein RJ641_031948 [Dillenia turbinata]|uniref:Uncharacterized protein n=1 Tax=Dillenia turbinata TaxID=194707 RepID=A0AAN8VQL2_9MAGN
MIGVGGRIGDLLSDVGDGKGDVVKESPLSASTPLAFLYRSSPLKTLPGSNLNAILKFSWNQNLMRYLKFKGATFELSYYMDDVRDPKLAQCKNNIWVQFKEMFLVFVRVDFLNLKAIENVPLFMGILMFVDEDGCHMHFKMSDFVHIYMVPQWQVSTLAFGLLQPQENYNQLNEALAGTDHSWTALMLKLVISLFRMFCEEQLAEILSCSNAGLLSEKLVDLEKIIKKGDFAVPAAKSLSSSQSKKKTYRKSLLISNKADLIHEQAQKIMLFSSTLRSFLCIAG